MRSMNQVLNIAKDKTNSDYATAIFLGVGRQTVSGWRAGRSQPGDLELAKLCELTDLDIGELFAIRAHEKAKTAEEDEYWEKFYKGITSIAASILVIVTFIVTPTPSQAAPMADMSVRHCILC